MLDSFELIINHLTHGEYLVNRNNSTKFEEFANVVGRYLNNRGKYLFEDEILQEYNEGMTLEKLFAQNQNRFIQGMNHVKNGVNQKTWMDTESMEEVKREDSAFDYFFIVKLRHLSLLDIDEYLEFHLEYSFDNNKTEYLRFVNLAVRQYQKEFLSQEIIDTVSEWIRIKEKQTSEPEAENEFKIKGRIQRIAGDRLTTLTQNQTVLLIQFMQKAGIILKDEILSYTHAGKAFHILTGYSSHTIRQQLGTKGEIAGVKNEDYKELHQALVKMTKAVEDKIHKK